MNIAVLVIILITIMNILFVLLHYASDSVPKDKVISRLEQGFTSGDIVPDIYPAMKYGAASIYATVGLDQNTDCFIYLMSLHADEDRWLNAVDPGIASSNGMNHCVALHNYTSGSWVINIQNSYRKGRLWHGAKPVFLLLSSSLNIFQINQLFKNLSYLGFLVLAMLVFYINRSIGTAMAPLFIIGISVSGIPYFGGIGNAIPFAVGLAGPILLLLAKQLMQSRLLYISIMVVIGSIHVYFYLLDGSLMLALPLILLVSWFLLFDELPGMKRAVWSMMLPGAYLLSFTLSFLAKQVISGFFIGFGTAFNEFIETVLFRTGEGVNGANVSFIETMDKIISFLNLQTYMNEGLYFLFVNIGMAIWVVGIAVIIFLLISGRNRKLLLDSIVIASSGLIVILRFYLMKNHSYIHAFIVGRYMFVFISMGWMLVLHQILTIKNQQWKDL